MNDFIEMEIVVDDDTFDSNINFSGEVVRTVTRDQIQEVVEEFFIQQNVSQTPKKKEVTLFASNWVWQNGKYEQIVTIDGVTKNSQVDLTPSDEQLQVFYDKEVILTTKNVGGTVSVILIGEKLEDDYTMQVKITEVDYE